MNLDDPTELFAVVIVEEVEATGPTCLCDFNAEEAEAMAACEVNAVIRTELALLLVIRKSCTLSNLQTSELVLESVEDTEPKGDLREEVSSSEVEEWVSPPLELWGLPLPVDSRSRWTESHLWFAAS